MVKEPSLPYYLPIAGRGKVGFIPFPRVSKPYEMQTTLLKIWTQEAKSTANNSNCYKYLQVAIFNQQALHTQCISLTSFWKPILVEIASNFRRIYRNRSRFYIKWKRTVCAYPNENQPERWIRHGGDLATVFWWNGHHSHQTCPMWFFYEDMWRD